MGGGDEDSGRWIKASGNVYLVNASLRQLSPCSGPLSQTAQTCFTRRNQCLSNRVYVHVHLAHPTPYFFDRIHSTFPKSVIGSLSNGCINREIIILNCVVP